MIRLMIVLGEWHVMSAYFYVLIVSLLSSWYTHTHFLNPQLYLCSTLDVKREFLWLGTYLGNRNVENFFQIWVEIKEQKELTLLKLFRLDNRWRVSNNTSLDTWTTLVLTREVLLDNPCTCAHHDYPILIEVRNEKKRKIFIKWRARNLKSIECMGWFELKKVKLQGVYMHTRENLE